MTNESSNTKALRDALSLTDAELTDELRKHLRNLLPGEAWAFLTDGSVNAPTTGEAAAYLEGIAVQLQYAANELAKAGHLEGGKGMGIPFHAFLASGVAHLRQARS